MKILMGRLLDKKFDINDKELLKDVSSYFLYVAVAIAYTEGYSLDENICTRGSCGTIDGTSCGRDFGCRCECHYAKHAKQRRKANH